MTSRRFIIILLTCIILICATSCKNPEETETGEFEAAVAAISENMSLDRDEAIAALEILSSLGLDERIEEIYPATDDEGKTFYKVWFGLNLLNVYLDGKTVSAVYKHGELMYPQKDSEETDKNNNNDTDGDNNTEDSTDTPKELDIDVVSLTSPVKAGKSATIEILGEPETEYTITVRYSSGASTAKGLEPKHSDSDGKVSWTWKVSSLVKPGEYSIEIKSGDASYKTTFVVE